MLKLGGLANGTREESLSFPTATLHVGNKLEIGNTRVPMYQQTNVFANFPGSQFMETRSLLRVKFFDVSFSIRKRDEDMDASLLHMLVFNSFLTVRS